jgi:hypothetical protein
MERTQVKGASAMWSNPTQQANHSAHGDLSPQQRLSDAGYEAIPHMSGVTMPFDIGAPGTPGVTHPHSGTSELCACGAQWCRRPRLTTTLSAVVRGVDVHGHRFEELTHLNNLSTCGLHLKLRRSVRRGGRLFIIFKFDNHDIATLRVALCGIVRRFEPSAPGCPDKVVVRLRHFRFLNSERIDLTHKDSICLSNAPQNDTYYQKNLRSGARPSDAERIEVSSSECPQTLHDAGLGGGAS